jgi:hypothetical protein
MADEIPISAEDRLKWLHSAESHRDKDGYEWGIFRVKWEPMARPLKFGKPTVTSPIWMLRFATP